MYFYLMEQNKECKKLQNNYLINIIEQNLDLNGGKNFYKIVQHTINNIV